MRISDWSADVCSSDLIMMAATYQKTNAVNMASRAPCSLAEVTPGSLSCTNSTSTIGGRAVLPNGQQINFNQVPGGDGAFFEPYNGAKHNNNVQRSLNAVRSEERRVGQKWVRTCSFRWCP